MLHQKPLPVITIDTQKLNQDPVKTKWYEKIIKNLWEWTVVLYPTITPLDSMMT